MVKNILGTVPVQADGSAYFEAPPGRALYFQALDADGRLVQSMRTFVQAVPGVTRSCIGCHEDKYGAPQAKRFVAPQGPPTRIRDESWGSGFLDYPTMIQPVLDKHCVGCHGGDKGISGGIDLTGGWTWAFNISYETLIKNTLVGFLNCHNSRISTTVLLPPRRHGSGPAPLAKLLVDGHKDRLKKMTRSERDLMLAWMDTNCNYYGTWNWTEHATCNAILEAGKALTGPMKQAGCTKCHTGGVGNDWVNLRTPERSRILRAPLAAGKSGPGLAWCRDRKARRVLPLVTQRQQPPDVFRPSRTPAPDKAGKAVVTIASTEDNHYQAMLAIIRKARASALARARVDMPGADIRPGACRRIVPMDVPETAPPLQAAAKDGRVALSWPRSSAAIGLTFRLYRSDKAGFTPGKETFLAETTMFAHRDNSAPNGVQHYALVASFTDRASGPARRSVTVRAPAPPAAPRGLTAGVQADTGEIILTWQAAGTAVRYHVYRSAAGADKFTPLTTEPIHAATWADSPATRGRYGYRVTGVNQRGAEGPPSAIAAATAPGERTEPTFVAFAPGAKAKPKLHGAARAQQDALDLAKGGHATFKHVRAFDPGRKFSIECRVKFDRLAQMPVVLSCGQFQGAGWFLQAFTGRWRWHLAGVNCDGGKVAAGKWMHLIATFDGRRATLYQDGRRVASVACQATPAAWSGPLVVGQYSKAAPNYQVLGRIAGVKLYRRALTARDAAAAFKTTKP